MMCRPKQPFRPTLAGNFDPAGIVEIPSDAPADMFIECDVVDPKSAVGRTVTLHVPAEQMVAMMQAARRHAAWVRSHPMTSAQS